MVSDNDSFGLIYSQFSLSKLDFFFVKQQSSKQLDHQIQPTIQIINQSAYPMTTLSPKLGAFILQDHFDQDESSEKNDSKELKKESIDQQKCNKDGHWIPEWSSLQDKFQSILGRKSNPYCPFCGKFIQTKNPREVMISIFKKTQKIYKCHRQCLDLSCFNLAQNTDDIIIGKLQSISLMKQHKTLILGQKQFYVELQIGHPLSSFTYFRAFKKLLYDGQGICWNWSKGEGGSAQSIFEPNMVCIPIPEFKMVLTLQDMSKPKSCKKEVKAIIDASQYEKTEGGPQIKSFCFSHGENTYRSEFELLTSEEERQTLKEKLNYKYKFSTNDTMIKLNYIQIDMDETPTRESTRQLQTDIEMIKSCQMEESKPLERKQSKNNQQSTSAGGRRMVNSSQVNPEDHMKFEVQTIENILINSERFQVFQEQNRRNMQNSYDFSKNRSMTSSFDLKGKIKNHMMERSVDPPYKGKMPFSYISKISESPVTCFQDFECDSDTMEVVDDPILLSPPKIYDERQYSNQPILHYQASYNPYSDASYDGQKLKDYVCSHNGSKQFQKQIQHMKPHEIDHIIDALYGEFTDIITHEYANYMFQSLIKVCSLGQRSKIVNSLVSDKGLFRKVVSTKQGTFALQQLISYLTQEQEFAAIFEAISDKQKPIDCFVKLSKDTHATHFIRKMVKTFPARYVIPLADLCVEEDRILEMVVNKNAICVVKAFFSVIKSSQNQKDEKSHIFQNLEKEKVQLEEIKMKMLGCIQLDLEEIIVNQFGNYIIQEAFDLFEQGDMLKISKRICEKFSSYSIEKFSNNLVLRCVKEYWNFQTSFRFLEKSLSRNNILSMYRNREGNRILFELIDQSIYSPLSEKIEEVTMNQANPKFNNQKWNGSPRKCQTGTVGTKYGNFTDAVSNQNNRKPQSKNGSRQTKKSGAESYKSKF